VSDERLRELERRALASDDPSDRARLALERLRLGTPFEQLPVDEGAALLLDRASRGELDEDRLRLAAYAGSVHARAALGPASPGEVAGLGAWASGLVAWPGAVRRAALAVARPAVLTLAQGQDTAEVVERLRSSLALIEERVEQPGERVVGALGAFQPGGLDTDEIEFLGGPVGRAIGRLIVAAAADDDPSLGAIDANHLLDGGRPLFTDAELRAAAAHALVQWALRPPVPDREYAPGQRYRVADVVVHPKFGRGTVQSANAKQVEIAFDDGVVRKLAHGL
jgi:hypothetical protein